MHLKRRLPAGAFSQVWAGLMLVAVALFGLIDHVSAKGPVSATITGPGLEQPRELIERAEDDKRTASLVVRLMEQTGLWYATGDLPRRLEAPPEALGPSYALTWINGGPPDRSREERTMRQIIYVVGPRELRIHTPAQPGLERWGQGVIGWFAAPVGLWDTLVEMGVPLSAALSAEETDRFKGVAGPALPQSEPANVLGYLTVAGVILVGLGFALAKRRGAGQRQARWGDA